MMRECPNCNGTGLVPSSITLECIDCQRKVVVTYRDLDEMQALCENVRCSNCRGSASPTEGVAA